MFGKKNKKKKKPPYEAFVSLKANGKDIDAINVATTKDKDGNPRLEIRTKDVCEDLHYDHVDLEIKTSNKMIKIGANFLSASDEKKFKLYIFEPESYNQFFI